MTSNYQKALSKKLFVSVEPKKLKKSHIDLKIRDAILKINLSDWVWTLWSCQGHIHKNDCKSITYISFCCVKGFETKLVTKVYESIEKFHLGLNDENSKRRDIAVEFMFNYFDEHFTKINLYFPNVNNQQCINNNIKIINLMADIL